ncbi:4-phosphoerythronate dehydrogenase [Pseudoteredinibacter isoporae]|uniref:4-phosphoerythronate dehydrogenase n=1 Tax=Pseudoteredinibacter isoporae TaxID=570281 RepID=UPI0031025246
MIILLDENIPMAEHYFSEFANAGLAETGKGELRFKAGREICAEDVADVDALVVRSVSKVNEALLKDSPVRFVGSCTIGMDHIDTNYLDTRGIAYANAPACNANSVVEYVFAALAHLACDWQGKRLGIIGMGNVGSALYRRASQLGIDCLGYDPLIEQDRYPVLASLDEVLSCDIVSMHAPLSHEGLAPTYQMIGEPEIAKLRPGTVLLNCGRGDCLDNRALYRRLKNQADLKTVLDVWQDEPHIHSELLPLVDIATPHIAGYSYDGKVLGTQMIAKRLADCLGKTLQAEQSVGEHVQGVSGSEATTAFSAIQQLIPHCYDIRSDDQRLRRSMEHHPNEFASEFDRLRKHYPKRREFFHFRLEGVELSSEKEKQRLEHSLVALGFSQ